METGTDDRVINDNVETGMIEYVVDEHVDEHVDDDVSKEEDVEDASEAAACFDVGKEDVE